MRFHTLDDIAAVGKTVLVRVDLNVPVADGAVTDTTRIDRLVPTLRELSAKGAKVVLLSHFGRPKDGAEAKYSLRQILPAMEAALGAPVAFADDCVGAAAQAAIAALPAGGVLVLENTRFHKGEEKNDPDLAARMAALGDLYVNDAFSAAHRAHASTEGIARLLPAYAGRLMQAELEALGKALAAPERPVAAVVGGAKISTKLDLLLNLIEKVDMLVLGGGMANTFLFAQGRPTGRSLAEKDMADQARAIMEKAAARGCEIILPVDGAMATEFKAHAAHRTVAVDAIGADEMMLDVGPGTVEHVGIKLQGAKTLVWNGPMGAFEIAPFDSGTNAVAGLVAALTAQGRLLSVAGGGDTVAALEHAGVADKFSYVSTAGGAFLEWLEGKELPGVQALIDAAGR
ncbi:MAG: phosphoglycerate kinase [Pseudomonadota bacterium]|jgi:phosphoglycerate kinase